MNTPGIQTALSDAPDETISQRRLRQVEFVISTLLRVGVLTSLSVVLFGMVLTFKHHPDYLRSHEALVQVTGAAADFPHSVSTVLRGALALNGRAIVMLRL